MSTDTTTENTASPSDAQADDSVRIRKTPFGRLSHGQTAIDFIGRRKFGFVLSALLIVATVVSLYAQGLNLGIDFEGGVSWEVPTTNGFTVGDAEQVLTDNGISTDGVRIQERSVYTTDEDSSEHTFIKVQVGDLTVEQGDELRPVFAEAAGVDVNEINLSLVSASWGQEITSKAVRALAIFLVVVAIFISIRFEWRMALAAIIAMAHDVVISVGLYSIFQFAVTPATVIAFLTILGYSLYDTIVVFDRVRENEARYATKRVNYDDIINVSMNQVLMRSLATSYSSIVPVVSLLVIGTLIMGVSSLSEFAIALLIGMFTGAYSSILVASPVLGLLKRQDPQWKRKASIKRLKGSALRSMVITGAVPARKRDESDADDAGADGGTGTDGKAKKRGKADDDKAMSASADLSVEEVLQHQPRPRRKTRR